MRNINSMSKGECLGSNRRNSISDVLPDKGRAIKVVGCLQLLGSSCFVPTKQSGPRLLSTVSLGKTLM